MPFGWVQNERTNTTGATKNLPSPHSPFNPPTIHHPSMHLPCLSFHLSFIYLFTHPSIDHLAIRLSFLSSIHLPTHPSSVFPFCPSFHSSIHSYFLHPSNTSQEPIVSHVQSLYLVSQIPGPRNPHLHKSSSWQGRACLQGLGLGPSEHFLICTPLSYSKLLIPQRPDHLSPFPQ